MKQLEGKTALVAGAGRNNGKAIALAFAREGADLVLLARERKAELEAVAQECEKLGVKVMTQLCDVSEPDQVERVVKAGNDHFGKIDVLMCVAGRRAHQALPRRRGLAIGDIDNDGRIDAVVSTNGGGVHILRNETPATNHWITLRLVGHKSNRDGIGARIRIGSQYSEMTTTVGYASSVDWGVHFGLGNNATAARIEIRWPSGITQTLSGVKADRVLTVTEPN